MTTAAITFSNYEDTLVVNSGAAVAVGDPLIATSGRAMGFAMTSAAASGTPVVYRVRGRCDSVPKGTADPWAIGDLLFWDATNSVATRTPSAYPLGIALSAQLATDASGSVGLTGPVASQTLYSILAVSSTLTSWTTFTAFSNGTYTIPANLLTAGTVLDIEGRVTWVGVNSTNTLQLEVKFAGTAILLNVARNATAGDVVNFKARVTILTSGASGTWKAHGQSFDGTIGGVPAVNVYAVASTAIDTTVGTNTVVAGAVCSVSNSGNQATLDSFTVVAVR